MGLFVTFVADVLSQTDNRISLSDVTHDRRSLAVNSIWNALISGFTLIMTTNCVKQLWLTSGSIDTDAIAD